MGGPVLVVAPTSVSRGPATTDNFAIVPFEYGGTRFFSVEQAFQALKFAPTSTTHATIVACVPEEGESASAHGHRVWRLGQGGLMRQDWEDVKVRVMLDICRAKLATSELARAELLSTLPHPLQGSPSTSWVHHGRSYEWEMFNGAIQMLLREELRPEGERDVDLVEEVEALFAKYASPGA